MSNIELEKEDYILSQIKMICCKYSKAIKDANDTWSRTHLYDDLQLTEQEVLAILKELEKNLYLTDALKVDIVSLKTIDDILKEVLRHILFT